jgi:ureidoacrylate peracid hydrolase
MIWHENSSLSTLINHFHLFERRLFKMKLNEIDLKKTGVLYFDMLNGYYHDMDQTAKARKKPMVDNAIQIMRVAREAGIPIYFAQGIYRADRSDAPLLLTDTSIGLIPWPDGVPRKEKPRVIGGTRSSKVIPELEPKSDDYYIPKYRWSAFHQTSLDLLLRNRGVDTIIISGGSTDVGVAPTVFAAKDMDYNMIVVHDACATNHDQRAHDILMAAVFPRMARVRSTREVLEMISEAVKREVK